jgi:anhydro-N-acetylmuramic acid kinase
MSGTSADGVDTAIVDIDRHGAELLAHKTFAYAQSLRQSILDICANQTCNVSDICHLNFAIGEVFADSVIKVCNKSGIDLGSIDIVGSHGQTIHHNPKGRRFGNRTVRSTLQIGEPSVIAQRTGITTVADFRPRDMAAGGQGAPLVPFADYFLFRDKRRTRAVQNIGGIANVTFLPANCRPQDIIAFDTGPGNMIIDRLIALVSKGRKSIDRNGAIAAEGIVNEKLLKEMLKHPYFRRRPPKSTGREEFGAQYSDRLYRRAKKLSLSAKDIMATATAFTAVTIAEAYRRFLPDECDEIILCGGGAHNGTLVKMLQQKLDDRVIICSDELSIDCDAKEAVSFAVLAYATIKGVPNNVPSATGAKEPLVLGKIVPA